MTSWLSGSRAHLIGIGGAGMSGVARMLLGLGVAVSGSDAVESESVRLLRELGVPVFLGHAPSHLPEGEVTVIISTAIRHDNPELMAARERKLPVIVRAEAVAALMSNHRAVCIAGSAGKTSTTSMLTVALQHSGFDPSYAIGGELTTSGINAHLGTGDIFVAEADESDGTFVAFSPEVAVVTNVGADHLNFYGTKEVYAAAFDKFAARIQTPGVLIVCADDPGAAELGRRVASTGTAVHRYGRTATKSGDATLSAFEPELGQGRVQMRYQSRAFEFDLQVPGEHMALNALGAFLAGVAVGASPDDLVAGLAAYGGVRRRFELKGRRGGVAVYDDYAHHPVKVAAQLRAARQLTAEGGRLIVAFQPHLYSRTLEFSAEFGAALAIADEVVVLDVYGAREDPIPGVDGGLIAKAVQLPSECVHYVPERSKVPAVLAGLARSGDIVITMGAGDITALGSKLLHRLAGKQPS
ncbi:UDP-N-acetylmuramate--L-alanine ligase [Mycolicibacterium doricum]|nr:UDP-N-acetylmuramate--L-alanine ligase [Mycolicibacterium doricum]MCV7266631.1 UDP-N-acetylmuramate--L-alanine ligase [Mycolicibacterium doricum]